MRTLRLSARADADITRLMAFQARRSKRVRAAAEARLADGLQLIGEHPLIGFPVSSAYRQLVLRFGGGAYVLRYRLTETEIVVTRIWHSLERRPKKN